MIVRVSPKAISFATVFDFNFVIKIFKTNGVNKQKNKLKSYFDYEHEIVDNNDLGFYLSIFRRNV